MYFVNTVSPKEGDRGPNLQRYSKPKQKLRQTFEVLLCFQWRIQNFSKEGARLTMKVEFSEDNSGTSKKMRYFRKNRVGPGPPDPSPGSATGFRLVTVTRQLMHPQLNPNLALE